MPIDPSASMQRNAITAAIMNKGFGTNYATPFGNGPMRTPAGMERTPLRQNFQSVNPGFQQPDFQGSASDVVNRMPTLPQPVPGSTGDWRGSGGMVGQVASPVSSGAPPATPPAFSDSTQALNMQQLPPSVTSGMDFNAPPPAAPTTLPQQPSTGGWTPSVFGDGNQTPSMPPSDMGNWGGSAGAIGGMRSAQAPMQNIQTPTPQPVGGLFGAR